MKQTTFNKIVKNIKQNYPHFAEDEIKDGVNTAFNELKTHIVCDDEEEWLWNITIVKIAEQKWSIPRIIAGVKEIMRSNAMYAAHFMDRKH